MGFLKRWETKNELCEVFNANNLQYMLRKKEVYMSADKERSYNDGQEDYAKSDGTEYNQPHWTIDARQDSIDENVSYRDGWIHAKEQEKSSK